MLVRCVLVVWCGWLWMQGCWMQNRTVQSLASLELACPPSVTPVVMQLQSEEGRNISLKCRVTGQYPALSLYHHYHHTIIVTNTITITSQHQVHHYKPDMPVNINRNVSVCHFLPFCTGVAGVTWHFTQFCKTISSK